MENFLKSLRSYLEQFADLDISTEEGKQELFLYVIDFIRDNIDDVEEASNLIELVQHIAREFPEDGDIEYFIEQFKEQSGLSESLTNINNMENYKILVYHLTKEVTEHNHEDGSIGNPKVTLDEKVGIKTNLNDLLEKISEEYNLPLIKTNWYIKSSKEPFEFYLVYERLENSNGREPSNKEMEDFKNGDINLFDVEYTFFIEPIREELTLEEISSALGIGVNESINESDNKSSQPVWVISEEMQAAAIFTLNSGEDLSKLDGQKLVDLVSNSVDEEPGTFKYINKFNKDGLTIIKAQNKETSNCDYIIFGDNLFYNKKDADKIIKVAKNFIGLELDEKDITSFSKINEDFNMDDYSDYKENYDNWKVIKEKNKKLTDKDREELTKRIDYLEELAMDEDANSEKMDDYYKEALYLYRILTLTDPAWVQ
jgi:hypothetical protein